MISKNVSYNSNKRRLKKVFFFHIAWNIFITGDQLWSQSIRHFCETYLLLANQKTYFFKSNMAQEKLTDKEKHILIDFLRRIQPRGTMQIQAIIIRLKDLW